MRAKYLWVAFAMDSSSSQASRAVAIAQTANGLLRLVGRLALESVTLAAIPMLVILGIGLRYWHFRENYSLNHDDICLALNVIGRNSRELMRTLDFDQAAPLGFLWLERVAVRLIGPGERALRLVPLVCGSVSIVMFARLVTALCPVSKR